MNDRQFAAVAIIVGLFLQQNAVAAGVAHIEANTPASPGTQQSEYERRELRRQHFEHARKALLDKNVPFDPEDLLDDNWPKNLKPLLEGMPEMQQVRYETAPLKGAYIADTLYLPEKVELGDHTVILARNVVFEGKNPVIKGNFDLHFFPMQPIAVLGTTLAEALQKKASVFGVAFKGKRWSLPHFSLISDVTEKGVHTIVFDTSGRDPIAAKGQHPVRSVPQLIGTSWNGVGPLLQQNPDPQCTHGCNTTPTNKNRADNGLPGQTGHDGVSQPKAPNGNCSDPGIGSNMGIAADDGTEGAEGGTGGSGNPGDPGGDARNIDARVDDGDFNVYKFIANGARGQDGGSGGNGGQGGHGGTGGEGGDGVSCSCNVGRGGRAGHGGNGGVGGKGGDGGNGGDGGQAATIFVSVPAGAPNPFWSNRGGDAGSAGGAGVGGIGGGGGQQGRPGSGAIACNEQGATGDGNFSGMPGPNGQPGATGVPGHNAPSGPQAQIVPRPAQTAGGASGGVGDPCLGGSGPDPGAGAGFTGPGGGVSPTCSPIIIDTEGEGFHLTSASDGIKFDIAGNGHPIQIAWTATGFGNAFLALPGGDGLVHTGKELFGNFTQQPASTTPNGYLALAEFDKPENGGNGDGVIDEHDAVYSRLRLWIDENHDGISQPFELHTLPELGVLSLSLNYYQARREDQFGNQFRYKAKVNPGRHDKRDEASEVGRWTYDVFFTVSTK